MDGRRSEPRSGSGSSPAYCSNCGESLSAAMNFCPNCGADCEETIRPSGPSISDREVLEYRITKAIEAGWELEHDFGDHAVVVRRTVGGLGTHALIALLTFPWTGGMGNVLYALYRYLATPERVALRADQLDTSGARSRSDEGSKRLSWWGGALTALVCWFGAAIAATVAGWVSSLAVSLPFALAAVALALGGVGVLPPVRRRLANRRSIAANGRMRSVDERSVVDPGEPCTNCATPIERGVERTYREEFVLLGVPLTAGDGGTNHYCRRCANAEFAAPADPEAVEEDGPASSDRGLEADREN